MNKVVTYASISVMYIYIYIYNIYILRLLDLYMFYVNYYNRAVANGLAGLALA